MSEFSSVWEFVSANIEWVALIVASSAGGGFWLAKSFFEAERNGLRERIAVLETQLKHSVMPSTSFEDREKHTPVSGLAAAAICYKIENQEIFFLLNLTSGRRWTFPKGRIKDGNTACETAERNALEECGAAGRIEPSHITTYLHWKQELKINDGTEWKVHAFLMKVERQQQPIEQHRDPTWYDPETAKKMLRKDRFSPYDAEISNVIDVALAHIKK